ATITPDGIARIRTEGKLVNLDRRLAGHPLPGPLAIGHTRWATHGAPTEDNAHPHATDRVAVVHNGIIENYQELKAELKAKGCVFASQTDTEIIAHLISDLLDTGLAPADAVASALKRLDGAFALAIVFNGHSDLMIGARRGSPLAIGIGPKAMYLASDAIALAPLTNRIVYMEEGDWVEMRPDSMIIHDETDAIVERPVRTSAVSGALIGKGEYRHFMQKEIHEQPQVVAATLNSLISPENGRIMMPDFPFDPASVPRLTVVACGTAFYAGYVAKYWFEQIARIPVDLDIASEFRYREAPMEAGGVALFISQSGETADTLAALRYAREQGQHIISVINVPESTIARESDVVLHTLAGPEIGVASTKAFTTQLSVLACLAVGMAKARGQIDEQEAGRLAGILRAVPLRVAEVLRHDRDIEALAHDIAEARDVLYLGRGTSYPIALEGALKLKEISYIHAEGYAAGEMKHGPIALIDEIVPIIVVAPTDPLFDKTASNIQEVVARGGQVLLVSDAEGIEREKKDVRWSIELPKLDPIAAPIVAAVPVQLLAYHVAVHKGTDVDQPRNLAKSVTVE
ncbi:MAG: glutamine--fructose-6-phosphate transaminase (isomerizing), partial [Pseudomonadota bacterium]|nr:glutamine--fructose-6-phosphate transaminase (isomerizing) [Pseudomonadota bacterium]